MSNKMYRLVLKWNGNKCDGDYTVDRLNEQLRVANFLQNKMSVSTPIYINDTEWSGQSLTEEEVEGL